MVWLDVLKPVLDAQELSYILLIALRGTTVAR